MNFYKFIFFYKFIIFYYFRNFYKLSINCDSKFFYQSINSYDLIIIFHIIFIFDKGIICKLIFL